MTRMTGLIILVLLTIGLGATTVINYNAYEKAQEKYENALDDLEQEEFKNHLLQEDNISMQDHIWHLNQNLMHREVEE